MFKASPMSMLPTSIIGSLPRPSWYTAALGSRSFLEAMVNSRYREQYEDAVSCFLRAQEIAGLDIVTDGDAHYDEQVGGMSWQSYPLTHMAGFAAAAGAGDLQCRRGRLSARTYPARLPRSAGVSAHHRPDRPRQPAIRRDVEDRAAHDQAGRSSSAPSCRNCSPPRSRTITTRTRSSGPGRSATRSTRSSTSSPMPAAR